MSDSKPNTPGPGGSNPGGPNPGGSNPGGSNPGVEATPGDPSMEDILASIRRILSDDEAEPAPAAEVVAPATGPKPFPEPKPAPSRRDAALEVLALDAAMIVDEPPMRPALPAPEPLVRQAPVARPAPDARPAPVAPPAAELPAVLPIVSPEPVMETPMEPRTEPPLHGSHSSQPDLVAPEAAAAAASSVGSLLRTLIAGREQVAVHRGGPTIEDLVREEIRPLLKQWLDEQLPAMVERLVRTEIERVVGRLG